MVLVTLQSGLSRSRASAASELMVGAAVASWAIVATATITAAVERNIAKGAGLGAGPVQKIEEEKAAERNKMAAGGRRRAGDALWSKDPYQLQLQFAYASGVPPSWGRGGRLDGYGDGDRWRSSSS